MARRCKSDEFRRLVEEGRQQVPDLNITSDIIVGFPGETEADWQQSLSFVEQMGFGHLHIFAYSPRSGTKAAGLPNPVPREIKRQRSEQLHQLGEQMKREMLERQLGQAGAAVGGGGWQPRLVRLYPQLPTGGDRGPGRCGAAESHHRGKVGGSVS